MAKSKIAARIDKEISRQAGKKKVPVSFGSKNILWFKDVSITDIPLVGGKGANLGEMFNLKVPVPPGFVITAQAYDYFIEKSGLRQQIFNILSSINVEDSGEAIVPVSSEELDV